MIIDTCRKMLIVIGNGTRNTRTGRLASRDRKEIERKIAALQAELDGMAPIDAMGVRELARIAGVSPTTATRAKRGDVLSYGNMLKLLPFMSACPCCKKQMTEQDRKTVLSSLNRRN